MTEVGPGAACPLRRTQPAKAATAFGRLLDCYRPWLCENAALDVIRAI